MGVLTVFFHTRGMTTEIEANDNINNYAEDVVLVLDGIRLRRSFEPMRSEDSPIQ